MTHLLAWYRWLAPLLICAACALQGCDNRPAPSPTPNPNPRHTLKLKITVEKGSEVNRVEVKSLWVVSNLSCAPVIWPEGYERVKQVDVPEKSKNMAIPISPPLFWTVFKQINVGGLAGP